MVVAWIMGIRMDLDFSLLETGCLAFTIIITAFTLQVHTMSYYDNHIHVVVLCFASFNDMICVHRMELHTT